MALGGTCPFEEGIQSYLALTSAIKTSYCCLPCSRWPQGRYNTRWVQWTFPGTRSFWWSARPTYIPPGSEPALQQLQQTILSPCEDCTQTNPGVILMTWLSFEAIDLLTSSSSPLLLESVIRRFALLIVIQVKPSSKSMDSTKKYFKDGENNTWI